MRPSDRRAFAVPARQMLFSSGAALAFLVQPAQADPDIPSYVTERHSKQFYECADRVGGVTAPMHECFGDEFVRIDAALQSAYQKAIAGLPDRARNEFRRSAWRWMHRTRNACLNDPWVEDAAGGSIVPFLITDCIISRMKARTLTINRRNGAK